MREVLVIKTDDLFPGESGDELKNEQGLLIKWSYVLLRYIMTNSFWYEKKPAETDQSMRQIIVYSVLHTGDFKKFFLYQRNKKGTAEKRLANKWSIGIGGHVELGQDGIACPLAHSVTREVKEEVGLVLPPFSLNPVGLINDISNNVGLVHIGILNFIAINGGGFETSDEIAEGRMMTINEITELASQDKNELEGWTKIVLDFLQNKSQ